jgi:hypothetical protein
MLLIDLCCLKNRSRGCDFGVGAGANIGQFLFRCRARAHLRAGLAFLLETTWGVCGF